VKVANFPSEIDKSIGTRLRERRVSIGLSQEKLAEALKIDPEDICFFEQGLKRIGAEQLLLIANALTVQPGYFFGVVSQRPQKSDPADGRTPYVAKNRSVLVEQGLRLQRAFFKVKNPALRESIINLVNDMAEFGEAH